MPIKKIQDKTYCKYCGAEINQDAQFCKKCGKNFNEETNLITRLNSKINLLSVIIGLVVGVIVLLVGASNLGAIILGKVMDPFLYLCLVVFFMLFLSGLTTGILSCKDIKEGLFNGFVIFLIFSIITGLILGIFLLITIGITSIIASAFSGMGTTASSSAPATNTPISSEGYWLIIQGILMIIACFLAAPAGGALGAWIRGGKI